jgi:hypothetical protein
VSERPSSLLSRLPGPNRAVWPSSSLKPDHTVLHRKCSNAKRGAWPRALLCVRGSIRWPTGRIPLAFLPIHPLPIHPCRKSELGRTEHFSVWPCLVPKFFPKFHYAKRRFSITSKCRQMHGVLNIDEIKN